MSPIHAAMAAAGVEGEPVNGAPAWVIPRLLDVVPIVPAVDALPQQKPPTNKPQPLDAAVYRPEPTDIGSGSFAARMFDAPAVADRIFGAAAPVFDGYGGRAHVSYRRS